MSSTAPTRPSSRDVRLDLFRGLAMLIIVIAHSSGNPWVHWIPARFGFSSAAEIFVFCSGFASALAFGRVFARNGFMPGAARVGRRIWQLYWAQLALFLVMASLTLAAATRFAEPRYIDILGMGPFAQAPGEMLLALVTLRFLPNFFDMLPMYIAILAMIPAVMALARIDIRLALPASFALWLLTQATGLNLPARPDGSQGWYFSPFAWQFLFFAGFAIASGWVAPPRLRRPLLVVLSAAIVLGSVPLTFHGFNQSWPALETLRHFLAGDGLPTWLGPARLIHFAALAYLVLSFTEPFRDRLASAAWARPMILIGRQTLPVFLSSIVIGWIMGIVFDRLGDGALLALIVNALGLGAAVAVAVIAARFRRQPPSAHRAPEKKAARPLLVPAE